MEAPQDGRVQLERYRDCADAIASAVSELIEKSVAAGWTRNEVTTALVNLAADLFPESPRQKNGRGSAIARH
jgi:hypothetical protein